MSQTSNLGLNKHDNVTTNTNEFDIENYLNHNWDLIDEDVGNKGQEISDIRDSLDTLEDVIKQKIYHFNTVAEMKACEQLVVGDVCQTSGYYEENDGGNAQYIIVDDSSLIADNRSVYDLDNGLKAVLLNGNTITPETFGAKGDGVTDDSEALQEWLDAHIDNKNYMFDISSKTYAIGTGLNINYEEEDYIIDFGNATIKALDEMNYMLSINTLKQDSGYTGDISDKFRIIRGGHWEGNNLANDIILYRSRKTRLTDMHLINAKQNYVNVKRGALIFKNSFLDRRNYSITESTGINITSSSSDSKISDIQARDISTFTICNGASIFYRNCHAWLVNVLNDTIYCKYSKNAFFESCYADTYNTVFEATNGSTIMWVNGIFYWNTTLLPTNYEAPIILKHAENYDSNINVYFINSTFDLSDLNTFGLKAKYIDTTPTPDNNIGRETTLLQYNRINPSNIDNLPPLAGYQNKSIETMTARNPANGEMTFSEVRYIGNGFLYVKGIFKNDLGNVTTNYGFGIITQNNIKIAEQSYLHGFVYNSSTPNIKKPIIIDITQSGYLHTFVEEQLNNIDRIEFSGLIRCNLLQGF